MFTHVLPPFKHGKFANRSSKFREIFHPEDGNSLNNRKKLLQSQECSSYFPIVYFLDFLTNIFWMCKILFKIQLNRIYRNKIIFLNYLNTTYQYIYCEVFLSFRKPIAVKRNLAFDSILIFDVIISCPISFFVFMRISWCMAVNSYINENLRIRIYTYCMKNKNC